MDKNQKNEERKKKEKSIFESREFARALKKRVSENYNDSMKKTPSKLPEPFTPQRKGKGNFCTSDSEGSGKKNKNFTNELIKIIYFLVEQLNNK